MLENSAADASYGREKGASVRVWDPFVRIFHWTLVALFAIAFLSGDESNRLHLAAGYGIAALIAMRLIWGFVGPRYARFSSFVTGPKKALAFVRQSLRLEAPRYLGHNPAGGIMIVMLLAMLIGLSLTGHLMTTDAYWGSDTMEDIHEVLANVTLGLVAVHIAGVVLASVEHGENLIRSMVTGLKRPLDR